MISQDNITIGERILAPVPKFFRIIRTFGLLLGTIGGSILAIPVALPATIVTVASCLLAAGTVATAVSQTTVDFKALEDKKIANEVPY
jgi:ABC-type xylose transport system permease subunit